MEEQEALLTAELSLQPQLIFKDTQKLNSSIVSSAPGCFSRCYSSLFPWPAQRSDKFFFIMHLVLCHLTVSQPGLSLGW